MYLIKIIPAVAEGLGIDYDTSVVFTVVGEGDLILLLHPCDITCLSNERSLKLCHVWLCFTP